MPTRSPVCTPPAHQRPGACLAAPAEAGQGAGTLCGSLGLPCLFFALSCPMGGWSWQASPSSRHMSGHWFANAQERCA